MGSLYYISLIAKVLLLILPVLLIVAFFTLIERKIISYIQRRRGPNVVGPFGLLQAIADGVKLIFKETIIPSNSNKIIFIFSPILTFTLSLISWTVVPLGLDVSYVNLNLSILFIFAISSLGVYGIIMSGWASNSKYAFLGALRSAAQMVSYEVAIGLIIISVVLSSGTLNLSKIVMSQEFCWYLIPHLPVFLLFFISTLAETNRHPFDFAEAESELVSGYNVEYSSMTFALFFLAEYSSMLLMSALTALLFVGGWLGPLPSTISLFSKTLIFVFGFIGVRAFFPRLRYDQLMHFGWKVCLPVSLVWVIFMGVIFKNFQITSPII